MKKSQAGIEYIILIGILLIFLIPVIHYALNEATTIIRLNQMENALQRLVKSVDAVYALGPGATEVVTITLPIGIVDQRVEGHTIRYTLSIFGGNSDETLGTLARVTGTLPIDPGTYTIVIKMLEDGKVDIRQRT